MDDQNFEQIYRSVEFMVMNKDYEGAITRLDIALKKHSKDITLLSIKIRILIRHKQYKEALTICEKMLKIDAKHPKAWYWKGRCYDQLKKSEKAWECYAQFKKYNPTRLHVEEAPAFTFKKYPPAYIGDVTSTDAHKVMRYFTNPEKLPPWDKQLCDLFMIADPAVRRKLKIAFPEMHEEFMKAEKGIYRMAKAEEYQELAKKG